MVSKKPFDEKKMHEGHRGRLLETVVSAGMENVSEVQAMEFILTYIFPRGDVNPLAHRLLHEFGSVANVLDSEINSLKEVEGMGDRSAKSLYMIGQMFNYYTHSKGGEKQELSNYQLIADYFEEFLRFRTLETFVIVALDAKMNLTQRKILALGSVKNVGLPAIDIANFVSASKPVYVLFAHNHPSGTAKVSKQDLDANNELASLLDCLSVKFVDHIIVGEDGIFSIKQDNFIRIYK